MGGLGRKTAQRVRSGGLRSVGPALGEARCPSTNVAKVCERTRTFAGARLEKNGRLQETLQYGRRWARGGGEGSGDRRGPAGFSPDPTVWTRFKRVRGSLTYGRGQVFNTSVTSREPQTHRPWTGVTHFLPRPWRKEARLFPWRRVWKLSKLLSKWWRRWRQGRGQLPRAQGAGVSVPDVAELFQLPCPVLHAPPSVATIWPPIIAADSRTRVRGWGEGGGDEKASSGELFSSYTVKTHMPGGQGWAGRRNASA